jgi:hypothetical protein
MQVDAFTPLHLPWDLATVVATLAPRDFLRRWKNYYRSGSIELRSICEYEHQHSHGLPLNKLSRSFIGGFAKGWLVDALSFGLLTMRTSVFDSQSNLLAPGCELLHCYSFCWSLIVSAITV